MNEWSAVQFAAPVWLLSWPLTVLLLGLVIRRGYLQALGSSLHRNVHAQYRHPQMTLLRRLYQADKAVSPRRFFWQWIGYAIFALGIHAALARPFYQGEQLPEPPSYRDAVFILDSSISMVLKDYVLDEQRVDRMTMLKHVMARLIENLKGNRIGIVSFSEQAYTLAPMSADYPVLLTQLQRLRPATLTGRTSRPGEALLYTLQSVEQQIGERTAKPVLILVSDVNRPDRHIDPRVAAEYVAMQGYRLHVIGIGGASYAAGEDDERGLIYHPSNFTLLEAVAERGNGRFYWAKNTQSLQQAIAAIQRAEQHSVDSEPRFVPVALYQWPLLFALIWLAILSMSWHLRRFR